LSGIIGYFVVAAVVIVLAFILKTARKKEEKKSLGKDRMNFTVHVSKAGRVVSIVLSSVFGAVLLLLLIPSAEEQSLPITLLALAFVIIALSFLYYSFRWKLVVAEDEITFTPLFGKKKKYNVGEITNIETKSTYFIQVYKNENRLFSASGLSKGGVMLISYLIEKGVKAPVKINNMDGNWY
jgi:Ca2+/Na+ antiporter